MSYLSQFQKHLEQNNLPQFIQLWQEYCLSDEIDATATLDILVLIQNSSFRQPLGPYVQDLLPLAETLPDSGIKDNILELVFELQTTNDADLATFAIDYLTQKYPEDKNKEQKLRIVGLRDKASFANALLYYRILSHMETGNFFMHTGGWGIGEVMDISMLREQITMEFDYSAGFKEISFINACRNLLPVSKEHFLAQRFGNIDAFEERLRNHPVKVIKEMLHDLGPKNAAEIRSELVDIAIPENEWTRWWQNTRNRLKKDPQIVTPQNQSDPFIITENYVSHEDQLLKTLSQQPNMDVLIETIFTFMRDFAKTLKNETFTDVLVSHLESIIDSSSLDVAERLQIFFYLQDLKKDVQKDLVERIKDIHNPIDVLLDISIHAHKKRYLQEIRALRTDWDQIFAESLLPPSSSALKEFVLKELLGAQKDALVEHVILQLLEHPTTYAQTFLWYIQLIFKRTDLPFSDIEGRCRFVESFFALFHTLETDPDQRELLKRLHQILGKSRFSMIRDVFKDASLDFVKEVLLLASKCQTINSHDLQILHSLAQVVYPELGAGQPEEEDGTIWTTEGGYQRIKERIEEIGTKETVANAKEIEIARSHGDLRENSDYKFALEKKKQLQTELRFLSRQFKNMRVLTHEDIDTSSVGVGTVVLLQNEKGEEKTYTFLGAWDVDPEHNILSVESKVAKCLKGMQAGDTCMLNHEEWKIVSIQSCLEKTT